jgi:hypothetical protein
VSTRFVGCKDGKKKKKKKKKKKNVLMENG